VTAPWFRRLADGLSRTREGLQGQLNVLLRRGPDLDATFWEELEEALISADIGVTATTEIVDRLKDSAARKALPDAQSVLTHLVDELAAELVSEGDDPLAAVPLVVLVVGVNGTGKTTTVAKLAHEAVDAGRSVVLGSADTFRAAAIEQLDIWAERAGVPVVARERGADPAAVTFDAIKQAESLGSDLVLVDTAGRLHTKTDLMEELRKVRRVAERESRAPVKVLLVLDATTGQNGLTQAQRFHEALGLDGIALTKLDGTAKGGIAVAIVRELGVPVWRVGFGEGMDDLKPFDARDFAAALVGEV
jgi:fused signal recognition particle receptor